MEENLIQINGAVTINVKVSVKDVNNVKNLCLESCYMQLSNEKYSPSIMDDSTIMCYEIIESFDKVVRQNIF